MVLEFSVPEVPVTTTEKVPVVAALLAVRVSVLEDVAGLELNDPVTPVGKPEATKLTLLLKPFCALTLIVLVPLAPCRILRLLGDAERVKFGAALTVSETVVLLLKVPDAPVTVTENVPGVAVLPAVSVRVLDAVAGFALNEAVTPAGKPEADKLTLLPKPFCGVTLIVLAPLAPCGIVKLLGDAESVKVGSGATTLNGTGLLSFMLGATETTKGPELAPEEMVKLMEASLQALMLTGVPFSVTMLLPCVAPKPLPEIIT